MRRLVGPRRVLAAALSAAARRVAPADTADSADLADLHRWDSPRRGRGAGSPAVQPEVVAGLTLTGAPEHWAARVRSAQLTDRAPEGAARAAQWASDGIAPATTGPPGAGASEPSDTVPTRTARHGVGARVERATVPPGGGPTKAGAPATDFDELPRSAVAAPSRDRRPRPEATFDGPEPISRTPAASHTNPDTTWYAVHPAAARAERPPRLVLRARPPVTPESVAVPATPPRPPRPPMPSREPVTTEIESHSPATLTRRPPEPQPTAGAGRPEAAAPLDGAAGPQAYEPQVDGPQVYESRVYESRVYESRVDGPLVDGPRHRPAYRAGSPTAPRQPADPVTAQAARPAPPPLPTDPVAEPTARAGGFTHAGPPPGQPPPAGHRDEAPTDTGTPWPQLPTRARPTVDPDAVIAVATRHLVRAARLAAEQAAR